MQLLQPDIPADTTALVAELEALKREQLEGKWELAAKAEAQTLEDFDTWVCLQIRRCIELTQILRRTNTGPAKPGGKRGGKKREVDFAAIEKELLG